MLAKIPSLILVIIQLVSFGFIVFTGPLITSNFILVFLLFLGISTGLWAFWEIRKSKFSPLPEVKRGSRLITSGPYQVIRHPMYSSLLIIGLALVTNYISLSRLLALTILAVVLLIKINREEKSLLRYFKNYPSYQKRTYKLIPFIY